MNSLTVMAVRHDKTNSISKYSILVSLLVLYAELLYSCNPTDEWKTQGLISPTEAVNVRHYYGKYNANIKFNSRAKRFLTARVLYNYTSNGTSSFQISRELLCCGDISSKPAPQRTTSKPKYPCGECGRAVRKMPFICLL